MTNVSYRSLDPKAQGVKYLLLRLPNPITMPSLCNLDLRYAVISGQTYHNQSFNGQCLFINPQWSILTELQAEAATYTLLALITESLVRPKSTRSHNIPDRRQGDRRQGDRRWNNLAAVKSFIDKSLSLESLDVTLIGYQFGMSRSSVYRMFASEGGVANYIRRRRLMQAFSLLVSPPVQGQLRILDIAIECGFSSDMVFTRAFRKMFSSTPSAVRSMAEANARA